MLLILILEVTGKKTIIAVVIKPINYGLICFVHLRGIQVIEMNRLQLTGVVTFRTRMSFILYVFFVFAGNVTVILTPK
jgi:hypothetical protein